MDRKSCKEPYAYYNYELKINSSGSNDININLIYSMHQYTKIQLEKYNLKNNYNVQKSC